MGDVGLFWDVENIQPSLFTIDDLVQYCEGYGRAVIRRAFADWIKVSRELSKNLVKSHFELYHIPHSKSFKNSSDIMMAVNSTNTLLLYPNIDYYIIVSNDKDFRSLIQILRMNGKRVILVCIPSKTSTELLEMVDEFVDINKLTSEEQTELTPHVISEIQAPEDEVLVVQDEKEIKVNKGQLLLDKLVEAVKFVQNEKGMLKIPHNQVLTRLNILYENLPEDIELISQEMGIRKAKWFKELLFYAKAKNLIDLEFTGTVYMISIPEGNLPTETSNLEEDYFNFIAEQASSLDDGIHISLLTNLCDKQFGVGYHKSLGYSTLLNALIAASVVEKIHIEPEGQYYIIRSDGE